jgi:hypothetical protein
MYAEGGTLLLEIQIFLLYSDIFFLFTGRRLFTQNFVKLLNSQRRQRPRSVHEEAGVHQVSGDRHHDFVASAA